LSLHACMGNPQVNGVTLPSNNSERLNAQHQTTQIPTTMSDISNTLYRWGHSYDNLLQGQRPINGSGLAASERKKQSDSVNEAYKTGVFSRLIIYQHHDHVQGYGGCVHTKHGQVVTFNNTNQADTLQVQVKHPSFAFAMQWGAPVFAHLTDAVMTCLNTDARACRGPFNSPIPTAIIASARLWKYRRLVENIIVQKSQLHSQFASPSAVESDKMRQWRSCIHMLRSTHVNVMTRGLVDFASMQSLLVPLMMPFDIDVLWKSVGAQTDTAPPRHPNWSALVAAITEELIDRLVVTEWHWRLYNIPRTTAIDYEHAYQHFTLLRQEWDDRNNILLYYLLTGLHPSNIPEHVDEMGLLRVTGIISECYGKSLLDTGINIGHIGACGIAALVMQNQLDTKHGGLGDASGSLLHKLQGMHGARMTSEKDKMTALLKMNGHLTLITRMSIALSSHCSPQHTQPHTVPDPMRCSPDHSNDQETTDNDYTLHVDDIILSCSPPKTTPISNDTVWTDPDHTWSDSRWDAFLSWCVSVYAGILRLAADRRMLISNSTCDSPVPPLLFQCQHNVQPTDNHVPSHPRDCSSLATTISTPFMPYCGHVRLTNSVHQLRNRFTRLGSRNWPAWKVSYNFIVADVILGTSLRTS
jgi:hypothetical protein